MDKDRMLTPERIEYLIKKLSLDEKVSLCSGKNFWYMEGYEQHDIPEIAMQDGPHGLRKQKENADNLGLTTSIPSTCFPTAVTLGSSWDRDLIREVGKAIAEECRKENVSILLGPGINIKRHPLCGRNFEYYSEDPLLSGELGASFIKGVQSQGVGTSLKHFAVNNQEYYRFVSDSVVDERTLREIYLTGFEIAVRKAKPWTVMAAYNKLNGTYCTENKYLLTEILRNEWGYDGVVISDWGAVNDRVAGIKAGMELEMPSSDGAFDEAIKIAVQNGDLPEEDLDRSVKRLLALIMKSEERLNGSFQFDSEEHHTLARKAAVGSAILLKNQGSILPLSKDLSIAVIGDLAKNPRYQGNGSSLVNPIKVDIAFDEIVKSSGKGASVSFARGYKSDTDKTDPLLLKEAVQTAADKDVVIIAAGLPPIFESEGFDREDLELPGNQNELIKEISKVNKNVVIVLFNGAPVTMPWIDDAKGILEAYLGGQGGGRAVADILFGAVNPSGKLAETFPLAPDDIPSYNYFPGKPKQVQYREGIFTGYRYYDSAGKGVLFPFGHGLSYTTFEYSGPQLSKTGFTTGESLEVSLSITNTGDVAGHEIIQVYIHKKDAAVIKPEQELKGFEKVFLKPKETVRVAFILDDRSFSHYDVESKAWQMEPGEYEIRFGASSRDIREQVAITVTSSYIPPLKRDELLNCYYTLPSKNWIVPDESYEALLGGDIPAVEEEKSYHLNSPIGEIRRKLIGRILFKIFYSEAIAMMGDRKDPVIQKIVEKSLVETPFRSLVLLSGGTFSFSQVEGILKIMNGHFFKGIRAYIRKKQ